MVCGGTTGHPATIYGCFKGHEIQGTDGKNTVSTFAAALRDGITLPTPTCLHTFPNQQPPIPHHAHHYPSSPATNLTRLLLDSSRSTSLTRNMSPLPPTTGSTFSTSTSTSYNSDDGDDDDDDECTSCYCCYYSNAVASV